MVEVEFSFELGSSDPDAEGKFNSRHGRKDPSKNTPNEGSLVKNNENYPFHQVQVELDVQTLVVSLDLPFFLWSIGASHGNCTLITHVTYEV